MDGLLDWDDADFDVDVSDLRPKVPVGEIAEAPATAPADEIEAIARGHQEALAGYMQRKLDAQRAGRLAVEKLEAERRELAATYVASLRRIETSIEGIRARIAEEVATADRLATYSRAALEALGS